MHAGAGSPWEALREAPGPRARSTTGGDHRSGEETRVDRSPGALGRGGWAARRPRVCLPHGRRWDGLGEKRLRRCLLGDREAPAGFQVGKGGGGDEDSELLLFF